MQRLDHSLGPPYGQELIPAQHPSPPRQILQLDLSLFNIIHIAKDGNQNPGLSNYWTAVPADTLWRKIRSHRVSSLRVELEKD